MKIDEQAIESLRKLVPKARYESRGQNITGTDYRNAWNSPIPALSRGWLLTKVTPPEGFDRLVDTLRSMLDTLRGLGRRKGACADQHQPDRRRSRFRHRIG